MTSHLVALSIEASDPARLARFWSAVLGWALNEHDHETPELRPNDDTGFRIRFLPSNEQKTGPNQMHFDLTSRSMEHQQETVARAVRLGGQHIDIGQRPEEGHVVLADPEGNKFCVIPPGNNFLADCGFLGALACGGTQQVGYFWSEALGWPLVWDQDQETAIRSPHGGPKITWGGPPLNPKLGRNRLHFDVAPADDTDQQAELERLLAVGATLFDGGERDGGEHDVGRVTLADPDGNEFCLLARRSPRDGEPVRFGPASG
ncbi:bleomycin resistance protein [Humibacillus sp. DSM 29435]|uniref:VOC family protein n=1 Tax=Humibacillus sp. DSM 29435 TaxID=1869167 RepID=UPI000872B6FA|nr:VOC family protein [Humibacillus sp. DSM 29435]OFE15605.1 bleomycin resistance protein [Humibacillus sp. DSM 29435]